MLCMLLSLLLQLSEINPVLSLILGRPRLVRRSGSLVGNGLGTISEDVSREEDDVGAELAEGGGGDHEGGDGAERVDGGGGIFDHFRGGSLG